MPVAKVNTIRLSYEVTGKGDVLAQLHGPFFGQGEFSRVTPLLAESMTVLDFDMRGFGDSAAPPGSISLDSWVSDLAALLDELQIERTSVHATSTGAMTALAFAAIHPDRIERLVLTCPVARYDLAGRMSNQTWQGLIEYYGCGDELLDLLSFQMLSRTLLDLESGASLVEELRGLLRDGIAPATSLEVLQVLEAADAAYALGRIGTPTLVIAARGDNTAPLDLGPSGVGARAIAEALPSAEMHLLDAAHLCLLEQPLEASELITNFLTIGAAA